MYDEIWNRTLLDYALEMVIIFNKYGYVHFANKEARQKLEYEEDIDRVHISDIFPTLFEKTEEGYTCHCPMGEEIRSTMAYRKNMTCFRAEAKMIPRSGKEEGILCMMRDVSGTYFLEKRVQQVAQEAESAAKVKSEFVANVTHELRTPVNGILGNVREIMAVEEDLKKLRTLQLVERGCNDMNNIINNILDFSKLEAGKFTLEMRSFNFRKMIDYVKSNHINKITEKGLDFFVTISPEIPEEIVGDELRIVQILNNLLSNACKFTHFGKVTLEVLKTAQENNRVELFFIVMDTGIGIDQADKDKLFKSFSQVDASISRKYGGTGLGLNISQQLINLMGGSISVESQKNRGTTFSFSLWFEVPEGKMAVEKKAAALFATAAPAEGENSMDKVWCYGTKENFDEIKKQLSKLILSVEMENWEKAETFTESVKQLTEEASKEIKTAVLRLKMAVQKGNYDRTCTAHETLLKLMDSLKENIDGTDK